MSYDALLEQIRIQAGMDYISDLPRVENGRVVAAAVEATPGDEHSAEAWNAVYSYISSRQEPAGDAETARNMLLTYLRESGQSRE